MTSVSATAEPLRLRVAALEFPLSPEGNASTASKVGAQTTEIVEPLKTTVFLLGDVGVVALPCEPFQGIGRLVRRGSPLPINIPCGYANASQGYITDSPNTGDREYMSSFYRYTKYRLPLKKPAGDVLAHRAVEILSGFAKEPTDR